MGRGVFWITGAQAALIVAQFVYGAITARIFLPGVFGGFAAALSLQSIFFIATTTGVPSYVLMRPSLAYGDLVRLRITTVGLSLVSAAGFWVALPLWLNILGVPEGMVFRGVLTASQLLAPVASLELALVRRAKKVSADALTFGSAGLLGLAVAAVVAVKTNWEPALALAPLVTALVTIPLALMAQGAGIRGEVPGVAHDTRARMARYLTTLSGLNAIHFSITQVPTWALSRTFGAEVLGLYNRATSATSTAASGAAMSITRVVQPYWRHVDHGEPLERALKDALRTTASVALPMFAFIAVVSPDFMAVWLGPGWGYAGQMAIPLAIGAGFQVVFAVLSNAYEMRSSLRTVRGAQVVILLTCGLAWTSAAIGASPLMTVALFSLGPIAGLTYLVRKPHGEVPGASLRLRDLGPAIAWAVALSGCAIIGLVISHSLGLEIAGNESLAALCAATVFTIPWLAVARRSHPLRAVLARRSRQTPPPAT